MQGVPEFGRSWPLHEGEIGLEAIHTNSVYTAQTRSPDRSRRARTFPGRAAIFPGRSRKRRRVSCASMALRALRRRARLAITRVLACSGVTPLPLAGAAALVGVG